mmetsp:Transcript_122397/g.347053  ORF Transcript_122397/g.347053 Transcript_122397/m.347053 type:complete len:207 (+) Transcript_122397:1146-1766(+)
MVPPLSPSTSASAGLRSRRNYLSRHLDVAPIRSTSACCSAAKTGAGSCISGRPRSARRLSCGTPSRRPRRRTARILAPRLLRCPMTSTLRSRLSSPPPSCRGLARRMRAAAKRALHGSYAMTGRASLYRRQRSNLAAQALMGWQTGAGEAWSSSRTVRRAPPRTPRSKFWRWGGRSRSGSCSTSAAPPDGSPPRECDRAAGGPARK